MKKKWLWLFSLVGTGMLIMAVINQKNAIPHFPGPVTPGDPIPAALLAELEVYLTRTMQENEVPGVAVALVQGDRVIYEKGMGVRDLETGEPVTLETLMGIGSTTKTMTAVMIGALVDEGLLSWDTPVTAVAPDFALSDPEITDAVTFFHTLCMCSGVPRRMEAVSVNYSQLTPEDIIGSLAGIPLVGPFGEHFAYSGRMLSAGGYLAAQAALPDKGLAEAYNLAMKKWLFDPLEMSHSTFSVAEAVAGGNYATPYYASLDGFYATPPEVEEVFKPIAPAGALWSNLTDMEQYLLMLLNDGAAPGGRQVISPETLAFLWQKQVNIDWQVGYGLGWHIEDYHGVAVYHHPGGTVGFSSELVVIPAYDLGFVLLSNKLDMVAPIGRMATYRLLEMLTGREHAYHDEIKTQQGEINKQVMGLSLVTSKKVNPDDIGPFLGAYDNEELGRVNLVLHEDNTLWLDFGEYEALLRKLKLEENQYIFFESIFVGKTLSLGQDGGKPVMRLPGDEGVYSFVFVEQTGP